MAFVQNLPFLSIILSLFAGPLSPASIVRFIIASRSPGKP